MKKSIFSFLLLVAMAVLVSCGESKLKTIVETANSDCPVSMGNMGEVTSIEYVDGNVVYNLSVNESIIDIDALNENPKLMKKGVLAMLNSSDADNDTKELVKALEEADAGLIFRYHGSKSGKTASVSLSRNDITDMKVSADNGESSSPLEALEAEVEITNAQCPTDIGDGLQIAAVAISGDYVVYTITVDENDISIAALAENKAEVKKAIKEELDKDDDDMQTFIELCKKCGKGVAYRYTGDTSGKTLTVKISASEL